MAILLTILKVIGIILLFILCIILYILLVPFFYRININGSGKIDTIDADAKVHSLLWFAQAAAGYVGKKLFYNVTLIWNLIKVLDSEKEDKCDNGISEDSDDSGDDSDLFYPIDEGAEAQKSNPQGSDMGGSDRNSEEISPDINDFKYDSIHEESEDITEDESLEEDNTCDDKDDESSYDDSVSEGASSDTKKKKGFHIPKIPDLDYSAIFRDAKKLLRLFRPRIVKADLVFSLGAPDTTGLACGVLSVFPGIYKKDVSISPDFVSDDVIIDGYITIKGHFNLISVAFYALRILYYYKKK